MLNLHKDLYARLVISAQKNRSLNAPFKIRNYPSTTVLHIEPQNKKIILKSSNSNTIINDVKSSSNIILNTNQEFVEKKNLVEPIQNSNIKTSYPIKQIPLEKSFRSKQIDHKIESIVENLLILEIRQDLENAEMLLKNIKKTSNDSIRVQRIEQTILKLKNILDQKTYI